MPANRWKRWSIVVKYQELKKLDHITLFAPNDKHVKLDLITNDVYNFASCIIIQITPPLLCQDMFENLFCDIWEHHVKVPILDWV